jgi:multisubunit Na+/H+ antiporter MnhG subunit
LIEKTGTAFVIGLGIIGVVLFLGNSGWRAFDLESGLKSHSWKWLMGTGVVLLLLSRVAYPIMKPVHIAWMTLAFGLGWFNTRLLLGAFFYLILTPIGVLMRLLGKDLLNERIVRSEKSYWKRRDPEKCDRKHAARMF